MSGERGTTSAYAENTLPRTLLTTLWGNYLRVRGEYPGLRTPCYQTPELPPRTRRIRHQAGKTSQYIGTTSAYAENTLMCAAGMLAAWNYLRVRGEYLIL